MIVAASFILVNLAYPPTWIDARPTALDAIFSDVAPRKSPPDIPTAEGAMRSDSAIPTSAGPAYTITEDIMLARHSSVGRLRDRVRSFKIDLLEDDYAESSLRAGAAINHALSMIDSIPEVAPLPKVTLLAEQISLYWDFGKIYAEIAVSENGDVSVYAKRPGHEEVLLDTNLARLSESGSVFPMGLAGIIF